MQESLLITEAKALIHSVSGKILSLEERKKQAIHLAGIILEEAQRIQTPSEKYQQDQLANLVKDPLGKVFTATLTDQCFRSHRYSRIADELTYVIKSFGVPSYLPTLKKFALHAFVKLGKIFSAITVPLTIEMIRKETRHVILPGEEKALIHHMKKRRKEGVRINLNRLGEAILGEEEAFNRLQIYLNDLSKPEVEYISVKISTLYSQINLLTWEDTLSILSERLRLLYRHAQKNFFTLPNGESIPKFVNLDMEEYKDLRLTVAVFRKVLDEPEFYQHQAGIVLQSYLPDSYLIQQELTSWAKQRVSRGGSPIKIRLVKGANLAMEQLESALRLWPQAPYHSKSDVDANYKRMVTYGCQKENVVAAHLGIGSHNLFDISYVLLLRSENNAENEVCFEMLEGMADHMRRVVQQLANGMLLYCPAATKEEFQNAVAYLVRRLDENTAPENFLRQAFDLKTGTPEWNQQIQLFSQSCDEIDKVSYLSQRQQNRLNEVFSEEMPKCFKNEPDTDWTLVQNTHWIEKFLNEWKNKNISPLPLVIDGNEIPFQGTFGIGEDPSYPGLMLYQYALASKEQAELAVKAAKKTENFWSQTSVKERSQILHNIANELRLQRGNLIGSMVADTGKTVFEADVEISEAIDFAEYYAQNIQEWNHLADINLQPKGTILVAPPWNFPCSIASGGILAALATGNCVIFKPPAEAVLVCWHVAQAFWKAGVSKQVLQFITCNDDPVGSFLVKNPLINTVILTGSTETAKLFLKMRPGIDLYAETGGKNTLVITGLSDRDLAIKDLIQSAFGHAGQKCSACSLAILEAEVYDDPQFLKHLKDATKSLSVGSPWDLKTKVNPLISTPNPNLLKAMTTLEEGEEWLLEPKAHPDNPNLWSPGIKLGVKPHSFTFQNELFGPHLSLVRARNVEHAFELMNQTPFGLTAGIHTLDEREQIEWLKRIEAGNCYINRTITGAIVERQPFGGCKNSSFGKGAKAGGPNYLLQFMNTKQNSLPSERIPNLKVKSLLSSIEKSHLLIENKELLNASIESDMFYWQNYFSHAHDLSLVRGQDNLQAYIPHKLIVLRIQKHDKTDDTIRAIAAAMTCETPLEVIFEDSVQLDLLKKLVFPSFIKLSLRANDEFIKKIEENIGKRMRFLSQLPEEVQLALSQIAAATNLLPVVANGRLELLNFLREVSISNDYHRYGNLGRRENELRSCDSQISPCQQYECYE